jgi:hypothetical protein
MEYAGDNKANEPGVQTPAVPFYTITYESENDIGSTGSTWSVKVKEKAKINLPGKGDLVPPNGTSVFVGWNDGLLTYPAGYDYTVTKDVRFNARWAFTALKEIETYLGLTASPVVIAVAGGGYRKATAAKHL